MSKLTYVERPTAKSKLPDQQFIFKFEDAKRCSGVFAFHDGYADAREYGTDGIFIDNRWTEPQRIAYLQGFRVGLQARRARLTHYDRPSS